MQDERERADAALELSCASLFLCQHDPALVLLAGKASDAPRRYAGEAGYRLVVLVGATARRGGLRRSSRGNGAPSPVRSELVVAHLSPDER